MPDAPSTARAVWGAMVLAGYAGDGIWGSVRQRRAERCRRGRAAHGRAVARALPTAALAVLAGCYAWGPAGGGTGATLPARLPPEVRVVVAGRPAPVVLRGPQVVGDSLVGAQVEGAGAPRGARVAVPLASVTSVEEERFSGGRTAGMLFGYLLVVLTVSMVVFGYP